MIKRPCVHTGKDKDPNCRICFWAFDDSETGRKYRQMWEGQTPPPSPKADKCVHLWKRSRDEEGKVKKRWCKTG